MPCHPNLEEAAAVETFLVRVVFIYQGTSGDLLSLLAVAVGLVHERKLALALAVDASSNCANVTKQKIVLANATKAYYCLAFIIMHYYHSIVLPIRKQHPNECPKSQYCIAHRKLM